MNNTLSFHFITNCEKKMLSTYGQKNILIGSRTKDTIIQLKKILMIHHIKYGRWLNNFNNLHYFNEYEGELSMSTNKTDKNSSFNPILDVCELNFNEENNINEYMYLLRHSDMFILENFEYNNVNDILTLQGIHLQSDNLFEEELDDYENYLESCYNNC
jgi:hypothetical protein